MSAKQTWENGYRPDSYMKGACPMTKHTKDYWKGVKDLTRDSEIGHKRNGEPVYAGDLNEWAYLRLETAPELLKVLEDIYQYIELQNVRGGSDQLNFDTQQALIKARGE